MFRSDCPALVPFTVAATVMSSVRPALSKAETSPSRYVVFCALAKTVARARVTAADFILEAMWKSGNKVELGIGAEDGGLLYHRADPRPYWIPSLEVGPDSPVYALPARRGPSAASPFETRLSA